ncbi:MAG: hypothetical protein ABJJ69_05055 [Paracoccaceae bacterium]
MNVGSGGVDAEDKTQRVVEADVYFHPEAPLVALTSLAHFRISFALSFLELGAELIVASTM